MSSITARFYTVTFFPPVAIILRTYVRDFERINVVVDVSGQLATFASLFCPVGKDIWSWTTLKFSSWFKSTHSSDWLCHPLRPQVQGKWSQEKDLMYSRTNSGWDFKVPISEFQWARKVVTHVLTSHPEEMRKSIYMGCISLNPINPAFAHLPDCYKLLDLKKKTCRTLVKWLKSPFICAALLLYMHEQKGRDESDDLSLERLLNNATCVLVGQKSHHTSLWGRRRRRNLDTIRTSVLRETQNYCPLKTVKLIIICMWKKDLRIYLYHLLYESSNPSERPCAGLRIGRHHFENVTRYYRIPKMPIWIKTWRLTCFASSDGSEKVLW